MKLIEGVARIELALSIVYFYKAAYTKTVYPKALAAELHPRCKESTSGSP